MTAPGFCTCKRDFPERRSFHPPINATWHFLCDKPVLPPSEPGNWPPNAAEIRAAIRDRERGLASCGHPANEDGECGCSSWPERASFTEPARIVPTGTGWPEDGEAQRIAEVFADARAEQDRGL